MDIKFTNTADAVVMKVSGEIDHRYSARLRIEADKMIVNHPQKIFVMDFSDVSFMDSSGIGVILGRYKLITSFGSRLIIISNSGSIDKIFEMSGIKKIIKIYTDADEAEKTENIQLGE